MSSNSFVSPFAACAVIARFYGFATVKKLMLSNAIQTPTRFELYAHSHFEKLLENEQIKQDIEQYKLLDYAQVLEKSGTINDSDNIKICPCCYHKTGIQLYRWQHIEVTSCRVHECALVNVKNLPLYDIQESYDLLSFERYMLSLSETESSEFAEKLLRFSSLLFRPLDFIQAKIKFQKFSAQEMRFLLDDVFKVLSCPSLSETWKYLLLKHRAKFEKCGELVMHHRLDEIANSIYSIQHEYNFLKSTEELEAKTLLLKYHGAQIDKSLYVSTHRFDSKFDSQSFSYQVDGAALSEFLGINMKSLSHVAQQNMFDAIYLCKQQDKSFYDMRKVAEALSKSFELVSECDDKFLKVSDVPKGIYDLFDLSRDELVSCVLNSHVDGIYKVNTSIERVNHLYVSEKGLKQLLKEKWKAIDDVNKYDAIRMLKINADVLGTLIENEYLKLSTKNSEQVDADSIREFVSNYLILNRKANFEKARTCEKRITGCCNVQPIFQIYMDPNRTDFVLYDKAHLNDCCMQKLQSRFTHFSKSNIDLSKDVIIFRNKRRH